MKYLSVALLTAITGFTSLSLASEIGISQVNFNASQVQFARVCGISNTQAKALAELGKTLNSRYIGLEAKMNYSGPKPELIYSKYLSAPYKLHKEILFTKIGWGEYNEAACVLVEGAHN